VSRRLYSVGVRRSSEIPKWYEERKLRFLFRFMTNP
jgi:hypothetical protein